MRGGVLSISNVTQEDAGIYFCEASNVEGSAEGNGTLKIKGSSVGVVHERFTKHHENCELDQLM